jgi:hypothetical protein
MATTGSRSAGALAGRAQKAPPVTACALSNGSWGCGQSRGAVSSMKRVYLDEKDWINVCERTEG